MLSYLQLRAIYTRTARHNEKGVLSTVSRDLGPCIESYGLFPGAVVRKGAACSISLHNTFYNIAVAKY